jgi:hypothetical protein
MPADTTSEVTTVVTPEVDEKIREAVRLAGARGAVIVFARHDNKLDAAFFGLQDDEAVQVLQTMAADWSETPTPTTCTCASGEACLECREPY